MIEAPEWALAEIEELRDEVKRLQEKVTDLSDDAYEYSDQAEGLLRENLALTKMLDEGQSLAMDSGDPETMYRLQRDLANWAGRANTLMYGQAKTDSGGIAGGGDE
jgi:hypothetical protein